MDQMELRSGRKLLKMEVKVDSDNDPEEDVQSMLDEYAVGGVEEGERIHPVRIETISSRDTLLPLQWTSPVSATGRRQ